MICFTLNLILDSSDMFQPTLDQLNPCFDELLQNFDFFTSKLLTNHFYASFLHNQPMAFSFLILFHFQQDVDGGLATAFSFGNALLNTMIPFEKVHKGQTIFM